MEEPERLFQNPSRRLAGAQERQGQTQPRHGLAAATQRTAVSEPVTKTRERQGQTQPRHGRAAAAQRRAPRAPRNVAGRDHKYQKLSEKPRAEGAGTAVSKSSRGPGATGQTQPRHGRAAATQRRTRPPKCPSAVAGRAQKDQKWSEKAHRGWNPLRRLAGVRQ